MNNTLLEAQTYVEQKFENLHDLQKCMTTLSKETKVDLKTLYNYLYILNRLGNGWISENDPISLDKSEPKKDHISQNFAKFYKMLETLSAVNDISLLDPYIAKFAELGVQIYIDEEKFSSTVDNAKIKNTITGYCCDLQTQVENNNETVSIMGELAEQDNFCPKSKFKNLAEEQYRISKGQNRSAQLNKKLYNNNLHNNGLYEVLQSK